MKSSISTVLLASMLLFGADQYTGSTKAVVTLVGGIIKAKHVENNTKFKRKDCPVCKGTGKYLSGDGIKMVDCGYCEPETKDISAEPAQPQSIAKPVPICNGPECNNHKPRSTIIKR